jgi:heptosyltransferase I
VKILIIKLSSLGDVIHTLPALSSLRRRFPRAHITWLVEPEAADLLLDHPALDHVLVFPKAKWRLEASSLRQWPALVREINRFVQELRSRRYDLVIDFQGLLKSGVLTGIVRGERKVGFAPGKERGDLFLKEKVPYPPKRLHAVNRYLHLTEHLACPTGNPQFFLCLSQAHRDRVIALLEQNDVTPAQPLVLLHPGTRWESKLWKEEHWAALGDRLQRMNHAQVVFTGSPDDRALVERIRSRMRSPGVSTVGALGLKELAFLQTQAEVVITPDSGPMHLAAAVGTPVVALFGPTDQVLTGPFGNAHTVIAKPLGCRPCLKRRCASPECMYKISVQEVWEAVNAYLTSSSSGESISRKEKRGGTQ